MVYIHSKIKFRPLNSIHRFRFAFKFPFITSIYTSYELLLLVPVQVG